MFLDGCRGNDFNDYSNSFDIMGVNSFYQNIIKGIIILLAVFLDLRGRKRKIKK